jgi:hypothetical protein
MLIKARVVMFAMTAKRVPIIHQTDNQVDVKIAKTIKKYLN